MTEAGSNLERVPALWGEKSHSQTIGRIVRMESFATRQEALAAAT